MEWPKCRIKSNANLIVAVLRKEILSKIVESRNHYLNGSNLQLGFADDLNVIGNSRLKVKETFNNLEKQGRVKD